MYMTLGLVMSFYIQHQVYDSWKKMGKLNFTKAKTLCFAEDTIKRMKKVRLGEIFAKHLLKKKVVSKICKEPLKPNRNNPGKKWAKYLDRHLTKEDV